MMRFASILLATIAPLGIVSACANPPAPAAADSSTPISTAAAPAAPMPCGPNAYRHESPDFCVDLPAAVRGKTPTAIENGVVFPGLVLNWAPKSSAAQIAEWKAPQRPAQRVGTFEVWTTEPMPRGTYFLIYDATQHATQDIYKVPSVVGAVVVEGETVAVRCAVTVTAERDADARALAASRAAELAACKSLRLFGRS
ncbi:Hypothetical protein A7982_03590 [Minicystis rosea]|nr:Hypothetical protein A7982_03590 [Minicystis rosea]